MGLWSQLVQLTVLSPYEESNIAVARRFMADKNHLKETRICQQFQI